MDVGRCGLKSMPLELDYDLGFCFVDLSHNISGDWTLTLGEAEYKVHKV